MTYVSCELECALEGYQWCEGLCFVGISRVSCSTEWNAVGVGGED
jgi:hypothetical protein